MDESIGHYRALLIAQNPDLQDALEVISDAELSVLLKYVFHLASHLEAARVTLDETLSLLDAPGQRDGKLPTVH